MKKFLLKLSAFVAYILLIGALLPWLIDPYNVFHADNIRGNGIETNKNYVKMTYLLKNPTKFDALLFGSSRVGAIHTEKMEGLRCYNMTYSAGVPQEHLWNIQTLIQHSVVPKIIFIGVDNFSYEENPAYHLQQPLRSPYEYLRENKTHLWKLYLNPYIALASLKVTLFHTPAPEFKRTFYEFGWAIPYNSESSYDWNHATPSVKDIDLRKDALNALSEIAQLCQENGIELVVFTNPMHHITYRASLERHWIPFLQELVKITDFYNFSGLNDITINNENYMETSHYKAEVGDIMLDCLMSNQVSEKLLSQGFGMYVTEDNISALARILENQQ